MNETWGKYRLESLIARGGMAEVFRASIVGPSNFRKPVCIKRIRPELGDDPEFLEMFEREARIAGLLTHPNIVQVFDFDRHDGRLFIAMELVDGLDLRDILRDVRGLGLRVPVGFALHVTRGLLEALGHAHDLAVDGAPRPVIHRDVSPHNVLVSADGSVKLADFGIAKARGASSATREGVVKGKLAYLSPEQARGEEVGPASDLFGAGLVLYEMLAGRRAFAGTGDHEVVAQVLRAEIPPLAESGPRLQAFLDRLLAANPRERFASAGEALAALGPIGVGPYVAADAAVLVRSLVSLRARPGSTGLHAGVVPPGKRPSRPPAPGSAPIAAPSRKRGAWIAAAGFTAVAAIALALWGVGSRPAAEPERPAPRDSGTVAEETPPAAAPRFDPVVALAPTAGDGTDAAPAEPAPAAPVAEPVKTRSWGLLDVHCRPWASATLDGRPVGTTPITGFRVPSGSHALVLSNPELGYRKGLKVEVRAGRSTVVREEIPVD
jgi:serine/threonine-protein kinase